MTGIPTALAPFLSLTGALPFLFWAVVILFGLYSAVLAYHWLRYARTTAFLVLGSIAYGGAAAAALVTFYYSYVQLSAL